MSKTAAGGEINVMDAGAFGIVTITKSISIVNEGFHAGVLATAGVNGIRVIAGVNDVVVIRGLDINGARTGGTGIRFEAGRALHVEDCRIYGFAGKGIEATAPTASAQLFVKDTIVRDNALGGILFGGVVTGVVDHTRIERNSFGVRVEGANAVAIVNSTVAGNSTNGIVAAAGVSPVAVHLDNTVAAHNGQSGVRSMGANASVRISNMTVMNNATGLSISAGGEIVSFGNNRVFGNTVAGAPTRTELLQ